MRIAVIGAGVSGLGAAYLLARAHDVTLYEKEPRAGGHVRTIRRDGLALDTGFLVHNEPNYPLLTRLFRELGVAGTARGDVVLRQLRRVRARVVRPASVRAAPPGCRRPLPRAPARGRALAPDGAALSRGGGLRGTDARGVRGRAALLPPLPGPLPRSAHLGALVDGTRPGARLPGRLRDPLLRPAPHARARPLPLALGRRRGGHVRRRGARSARREGCGWARASARSGALPTACSFAPTTPRSTSSTRSSSPRTPTRRSGCSRIRATTRRGCSAPGGRRGTRRSCTPTAGSCRARPAARASWNYQATESAAPTLTYYLNRLQRLESDEDWCVTLNRTSDIDPERIVDTTTFEHPVYTVESLRAQGELRRLSGEGHTLYAGAYHGFGFHEDGLASGVRAAAQLGVGW